jgi:hypothetical protein
MLIYQIETMKSLLSKKAVFHLSFRLTKEDIEKIRMVKDKYGYTTTADMFRYLLTREYEKILEKQQNFVNIDAEALMESTLKNGGYSRQERIPVFK